MAQGGTRKTSARLTASVVAGLLLVPASAIAAVAIVGATRSPSPGMEAASTTTVSNVNALAVPASLADIDVSDDHIDEACGTDAGALVAFEQDGSISDIQAAALDALREICSDHGRPIAAAPAPAPVVRVVKSAPSTPTTTEATDADQQGDDQGDTEDTDSIDDDHGESDDGEHEDSEHENHEHEEDEDHEHGEDHD